MTTKPKGGDPSGVQRQRQRQGRRREEVASPFLVTRAAESDLEQVLNRGCPAGYEFVQAIPHLDPHSFARSHYRMIWRRKP